MIVLITPTGGRQDQINLCYTYMMRQTYPGQVLWIIVDDCLPRTTDGIVENCRENWSVVKIHPVPVWMSGNNTQSRNMNEAVSYVQKNCNMNDVEAIFIIEDDDYYRANYLERMMAKMNGNLVIGETNTIYYNVLFRKYADNNNKLHASLFQVAMKPQILPLFLSCFNNRFIDFTFFGRLRSNGYGHLTYLFFDGYMSIGIKGIKGRGGIGAGHGNQMNMLSDLNMNFLTKLIGNDAKLYEGYYGYYRQPQHDILTKKRF